MPNMGAEFSAARVRFSAESAALTPLGGQAFLLPLSMGFLRKGQAAAALFYAISRVQWVLKMNSVLPVILMLKVSELALSEPCGFCGALREGERLDSAHTVSTDLPWGILHKISVILATFLLQLLA